MSVIIRIIVNAVALWAAVLLVDGIDVGTDSVPEQILVYLVVGAIFGVVNAVIKPIVKTVGCAFYILTLGLIALVVNALLLLLTGWLAGLFDLPFSIDGFWPAFWGAIIVAVVSWLLSLFVGGDDD
ncbi:putative membrane protein [Spinactinospora alkalitolerans]|uniref:Putative membrane protein n=1 Tax=Spinactinospora alkalitolerans TaxID=687207 RepID=A0A852U5D7_9ACTN|nr:phage holin family protein [Spinactinospora alkalitolerans]NYE49140.1 putative membrane protein [Spinactinospora alkalitolerans]